MSNPTTEDALFLATKLEKALEGQYHVGLTGSQLYGDRPGHTATFKDIDLIVYPGKANYLNHMKVLLGLQRAGLKFVRYGNVEYPQDFAGRQPLLPPAATENQHIWVMDYNGTRVDVFLKQ